MVRCKHRILPGERENTMKKTERRFFTILLTAVLLLTLCTPAFADSAMTAGEEGLALIEGYEGMHTKKYSSGGKWYIGYGTQIGADDYPDGITQEQAEELLCGKLAKYENTLNEFFAKNNIIPTQGQFDALLSFTYNFGTSWLTGTSNLVQIVRGDVSATRLETAQAFGEWCHSGGKALGSLALRRLKEASLYLDGSTDAAESEFAYLIIEREDGTTYETDFRVYERGKSYGSFPKMEKLGYTLSGLNTSYGKTITESTNVAGNLTAKASWKETQYSGNRFSDLPASHWSYNYVMELAKNGVINGNPDGTFAPSRAITTGEALKLILLAAGHSAQTATESHWASGYGSYAVTKGYLTKKLTEDLNGTIKRVDIARLAAKAIGYGQSAATTPFADTKDGYVTALYEAGILTGMEEDGTLVFKPDSSITRAEVATIVWRLGKFAETKTKQIVKYRENKLSVVEGVPKNSYNFDDFYRVDSVMHYKPIKTKLGIDVSRYQDTVDWNQVSGSGIEFVIARVGSRGYTEGNITQDAMFDAYADGAAEAGLEVGAYFFSQAVNVEEAKEEAQFVLDCLSGHEITGPVIFDWELIGGTSARTYSVEKSVLTDCAIAFCETVRAAGYTPMVYVGNTVGYLRLDLSRLTAYDLWYAQYDTDYPGFFYDFLIWQYTSKGRVPGIEGNVDMDIWFIK